MPSWLLYRTKCAYERRDTDQTVKNRIKSDSLEFYITLVYTWRCGLSVKFSEIFWPSSIFTNKLRRNAPQLTTRYTFWILQSFLATLGNACGVPATFATIADIEGEIAACRSNTAACQCRVTLVVLSRLRVKLRSFLFCFRSTVTSHVQLCHAGTDVVPKTRYEPFFDLRVRGTRKWHTEAKTATTREMRPSQLSASCFLSKEPKWVRRVESIW